MLSVISTLFLTLPYFFPLLKQQHWHKCGLENESWRAGAEQLRGTLFKASIDLSLNPTPELFSRPKS